MAVGKEILKRCLIEVIETGNPTFIAEDNPKMLASLLVRVHRLRSEMKEFDPFIEEKVEISKEKRSHSSPLEGILLSRPKSSENRILKGDGKGGWSVFKELYPDRDLERVIYVMQQDGASLADAKEMLVCQDRTELEIEATWIRLIEKKED